jgi:hypothetical protein
MNKFSSTKNYFYALLLTSTVLALGACSSSDEQPADTSGQSAGDEVDCSTRATDAAERECEAAQEYMN